MKRTITKDILQWYNSSTKALLIDGARQVGKTYSIREFANTYYANVIEINFYENKEARDLVNLATNSNEILLYLSSLYGDKLIPGKTLIFFDEIQECNDIVTAIKFLIEDNKYRYILSGSLLGVEMSNVLSIPVGYMDVIQMYPLNFYEFCLANGVGQNVIDYLNESYINMTPIQDNIHDKMLRLFHLYLIVGGMPAVVQKYLDTNNLQLVEREQRSIIRLYKDDIAKYDKDNKLLLGQTFDLIPSELNSQNKRFFIADIKHGIRFDDIQDSFIWLVNAGVAIPTYCVNEPKIPLILSKSRNLLKLFLNDVGLLAAMYADNIQLKLIKQEIDINYGGIYENAVAQELKSNGLDTYYYKNNKLGELDFVLNLNGECVILEVKSGKNYYTHSALNNALKCKDFNIKKAIVLCNYNISQKNNIIYYPIYMTMFMKNKPLEEIIYKPEIPKL